MTMPPTSALEPFTFSPPLLAAPVTAGYGDQVIVGETLPPGANPLDYYHASAVPYVEEGQSVFGHCCGPKCERCTSIPPCPPFEPPIAPGGNPFPIHIKKPAQLDPEGLSGSATSKFKVFTAGTPDAVKASLQSFFDGYLGNTGRVAFHIYRIVTCAERADLVGKLVAIPIHALPMPGAAAGASQRR